MANFSVISLPGPNAKLALNITEKYGNNSLAIANNAWFIRDDVTTKDVCDKIGVGRGTENVGQVVVTKVESYFGFAPAHIWEWLTAKSVSE